MLQVGITYNPYFVTTEIIIDGEKVRESSKLFELCRRERIQNWIDKFLPVLYEERREKKVVIDFRGTALDAEDVRSAVEEYNQKNPGHNFSLGKVESRETGRNHVTKLKKLYQEGQAGPFAELFNSKEMQQAFNRALDPRFEVNVIATMSSGKSTFVNALLGKRLMPAKNEACTATITRIEDDSNAEIFTAQRFNKHGKPLSSIEEATYTRLSDWNADSETSLINVKGDIPTVQQTDECTMVFVDTPGPNNAKDEHHKKITKETIKSKPLSMILYILNSTQLCTTDDRWLLDEVCSAMSSGGRQAQDRFIFVANKIDAFDPEQGESVTKALEGVRDYLQAKDKKGYIQGIENPLIIPTSARLAELLRIKRTARDVNLTRNERGDLAKFIDIFVNEKEMNMVNHAKNRLNPGCIRRLEQRLDSATNDEEKAEVLSGIPIIEELLNDFLQKHAMPAKFKDAVDSFDKVMKEAKIAEHVNELLSKADAELKNSIAKINAFMEDESKIKKGKKFRLKIVNIKYDMSNDTYTTVMALREKGESVARELGSMLLDETVSKNEAEKLISNAISKCDELQAEIIATLRKAIDSEYLSVMKKLREEYQEYIESVLNESFPDDIILRDLQFISMDMPPAEEMIRENIKVESVYSHSVTESVWENYNLISLNWSEESRTRRFYKNVSKVTLGSIRDEIDLQLREMVMKNIYAFQKQASEDVETAKAILLGIMDCLDKKIVKIQSQLNEAQEDHDKKMQFRDETQKKKDWHDGFSKKLQDILAV